MSDLSYYPEPFAAKSVGYWRRTWSSNISTRLRRFARILSATMPAKVRGYWSTKRAPLWIGSDCVVCVLYVCYVMLCASDNS